MKTSIVVSLQVEGTHSWPECPIEEVAFLKNDHRHIFFIQCKKTVTHTDRQVEIIQLKRRIQAFLVDQYSNTNDTNSLVCLFGRMSCEDIAYRLFYQFNLSFCSVLEDNENGAEVEK
jgi:hypothetical protein